MKLKEQNLKKEKELERERRKIEREEKKGKAWNVLVLRVKEMFLNYSAVKNANTRLCLIIQTTVS
jgi:hypothetical protein